jgi:hypothetical protein
VSPRTRAASNGGKPVVRRSAGHGLLCAGVDLLIGTQCVVHVLRVDQH